MEQYYGIKDNRALQEGKAEILVHPSHLVKDSSSVTLPADSNFEGERELVEEKEEC